MGESACWHAKRPRQHCTGSKTTYPAWHVLGFFPPLLLGSVGRIALHDLHSDLGLLLRDLELTKELSWSEVGCFSRWWWIFCVGDGNPPRKVVGVWCWSSLLLWDKLRWWEQITFDRWLWVGLGVVWGFASKLRYGSSTWLWTRSHAYEVTLTVLIITSHQEIHSDFH